MALSRKTPLKRSGTLSRESSKLSGGGPIKHKQKTQAEKDQQSADIEAMWSVFMEIWDERPHYSEVSGKWLGPEPKSWMFDHLLEKGVDRYKHLKYEKMNIALVTADEHCLKTNGNPLPRHQELIYEATLRFIGE